ncbi:MAG TPA: Glu/Leu/Phe/Val dehydrogenase dimerization domain-containing protein [Gaiellaceae bacterium]
MFEELFERWDGEQAVVRYDRESGGWIFVCVHSTVLGPAAGGTRLRVYATPADGLADAMKLSRAMTVKWAGANLPSGGGKAVLAVPELPTGDARRELLLRYGDVVQSLGGLYRTAGDMNITPNDLDVVHERCDWVYGTTTGGGNSGRGTAIAVHAGLEASAEHVFGSPDLKGRSVLVQGAGAVGEVLVRLLHDDGADVLVSDVDEARARATGATVISPADVYDTECDIYSPCAVGGTLNAGTIPRLRCKIVGGSANNQLAEPEDAARLHERGILYAPDFIINAGGIIQLYLLEDRGASEDEMQRALRGVGDTLRDIFARGGDPATAAEQLAAERIAQKRAEAVA